MSAAAPAATTPAAATPAQPKPEKVPGPQSWAELKETLVRSGKRALGGGVAGASAMALQVLTLMWMRTIMNYQYRYGTTFKQAAQTLYKEGGIPRFYKGLIPALAQGPLSRFGDTASNAGTLALLNSFSATKDLAVPVKTMCASSAAALFRICLMPIDTFKTVLQVEGSKGLPILMNKFRANGFPVFFHGALAASAATFAGHLPWFTTYNFLDARLPVQTDPFKKLLRSAGMGFCSSVISDSISNSIRVVKTYRQTSAEKVSYPQAVKNIIESDGVLGLMGRGLKTRILTNGAQGLMFSVLWRYFDEKIQASRAPKAL